MHSHDLGEVSRELFAQFLYRIRREFMGKQAWLGLFSTLKYLNATNDQKLRDNIFQYHFRRGFIFSSANFDGTSRGSPFPVGFLLWNLATRKRLDKQQFDLDILDSAARKTGSKTLVSEHKERFLSKWIDRPSADIVFPPFSSAIRIKTHGPDVRDRVSKGFLGSLMCKGNDVQNQNMTALLSGPYASAGALSITPENFEKALVVHAVRRVPQAEWHNDRDQFMQPLGPLNDVFISDCVVWSIFSNSNHTVAMKDVKYGKKTWQIPNHFFSIPIRSLSKWQIADDDIALQLRSAENRFVAQWLDKRSLSSEASELLQLGEDVFRLYFKSMTQLRTTKFCISTWDAGWWQVRSALKDVEIGKKELKIVAQQHDVLRNKLKAEVLEYGFLHS